MMNFTIIRPLFNRYIISGHYKICSPHQYLRNSLAFDNLPTSTRRFSTHYDFFKNRRISKWIFYGSLIGAGIYAFKTLTPDRRELIDPQHYYSNLQIRLLTSLPWSIISRTVGVLSNVKIPMLLREKIYGFYVWFYNCRMDEAVESSLKSYPTFATFFNRAVREGVRPISNSLLVSPADGTVLHFGKVLDGRIEYVKDNDYEIHEFLGPINVDTKIGNALFQIVIYLAPGDYHGFHSPSQWRVFEKIHFPGFLLSVRPKYFTKIPKLFCLNERIVLSGQWKYGYFSMSAVAATNVGDIIIINEPIKDRKLLETQQFDIYDEKMNFKHGDKVGEFRMGSTIVLIFEAPESIEFCINAGDKLRYGQSLLLQNS